MSSERGKEGSMGFQPMRSLEPTCRIERADFISRLDDGPAEGIYGVLIQHKTP